MWKTKTLLSCKQLFILVFTSLVLLPGCYSQGFNVKGTVKCLIEGKYKPLPYTKVQLLVPQLDSSQLKSTPGRTNKFGQFQFPLNYRVFRKSNSTEKLWPCLSVRYSYNGPYGSMEILSPVDHTAVQILHNHTSLYRRNLHRHRTISFNVRLNDGYCQAFYRMHRYGFEYYHRQVAEDLPYYILYLEDNHEMIHSGVPHSGTYTINVNGLWHKLDSRRVKHLFGHSVRQTLDGGFYHTLMDSAQFRYRTASTCSDRTNQGQAFNEGWAHYWSNECTDSGGRDYSVEGDVASALRRLALQCKTTKKQMVNVLRQNPGALHSFCQFNRGHLSLYNCSATEACTAVP